MRSTTELQRRLKPPNTLLFYNKKDIKVQREGFEPPYSMRADLQSAAFNHSATFAYLIVFADINLDERAGGRYRTDDLLFTKQLLYH